ncbi:MAG TPA: zf-HC2 domain-containing protein [Clostridiales bacterium]|nr:zf-HC2 domain-containing protein [Clostridiales bacterium]
MTCMYTQRLITSFINDELSLSELDKFIHHVKACDECYEELEVYFTLLTAMKQLDEEQNLSNDYRLELKNKIYYSEEKIVNKRIHKIRKIIMFCMIVLFTSTIISFKNGVISKEAKGVHSKTISEYNLKYEYKSNKYINRELEYNNYLNVLFDNKN